MNDPENSEKTADHQHENTLLKREIAKKDLILSLSSDIAHIKAKKELMQLIKEKFQKLFYFYHCTIVVISEDKKTFKAFLLDPNSKMRVHENYNQIITSDYKTEDGVVDKILASDKPVIFNLDHLVTSGLAPGYIVIMHESGIKELMGISLENEGNQIGALAFYSDVVNNFNAGIFPLIGGIVSQISLAVVNILATEALESKIKEREILLSVSDDIARMKDRSDLLEVINRKLKQLFYFTHSIILQLSGDQQYATAFLLDPKSKSKADPDYEQIVSRRIPVNDGIVNLVLEVKYPVLFDIEKEAAIHTAPDYIKMNYKAGLKEFMAVALRKAEGQALGILTFYSDKKGSFGTEVLNLIQGIAYHISTAMENILYHEDIQRRDRENEILLEINIKMVAIQEKEDYLNMIRHTIKKYIPYDDSNILVYNKQRKTYKVYLYDVLEKRLQDPLFLAIVGKEYPAVNDVVHSHYPNVRDVEELARTGLDWAKMTYERGVREIVHVKLADGNETLGLLILLSETKNCFTQEHLSLLHNISYHLAKTLANLLAKEEVRLRENEKSVLLSLSKYMAQTRNKHDLLEVIRLELKRVFYFCQSSITLISEDRNTMNFFLIDPASNLKHHQDYEKYIRSAHQVEGVSSIIIGVDKPLLFNLDKLTESDAICGVLKFQYDLGIKELVSVGLRNEKEIFGILTFYADIKNTFNPNHIEIIHGVANQVAIAVSNIIANENIERQEKDTQILLSLSADIDKVRDRNGLSHIIRHKLTDMIFFADMAITLYNPLKKTVQVFAHQVLDKRSSHPEFSNVLLPEYLVEDGIHEVALYAKEPVIVDIDNAMKSPNKHRGTQFIYDSGIKRMLLIKLTNNNEVLGFLNILSEDENAFLSINLNILKGITDQLSTAISNILSLEEIQRRDRENDILLSVSHAIASIRDKQDMIHVFQKKLKSYLSFSDIAISVYNLEKGTFKVFLEACEQTNLHPDFKRIAFREYPIADGIHDTILNSDTVVVLPVKQLLKAGMVHIEFLHQAGIKELAIMKLQHNNKILGSMVLLSGEENSFSQQDTSFIQRLSYHLATAVSNIIANEKIEQQLAEINTYKQQLEEEKLYLQQEVSSGYTYSDIIGSGPEMQKVFHLLSQVAFANSTVLLLGETGTGKELIARAIHNSSPRKDKLMVKVNCAALPANLIESEFFGHERGSFTGATERRIGKFELANHGTLFLDEIGEMPLDLQVKLLRAIQEKEIERVGGKTTIKTDVRIIAATNRNLQKEVDEGRFRRDLYYRLNVFPITLPPLRNRKEDIPVLASHFVDKYAKNTGKKISSIAGKAMKEMMAYSWPGNVRELEHLIERSVLMTSGITIKEMYLPTSNREELTNTLKDIYPKTHEENERDYIIEVLKRCNGKIFGSGGAAEILNMKVATLNSKIRKLGITKEKKFLKKNDK